MRWNKGRGFSLSDSSGETLTDDVDLPVRSVDAQWQCTAHLGIVAQRCERGLGELFGQCVAGPAVDSKREVDGDLALRLGGMQPATRQVEDIPWLEHRVDVGLAFRGLGHGGAAIGPGLITQRVRVDRLMDDPALGPLDLQDEDVVDVVVIVEPTVLRRRDVGIGLHRMSELGA